jgi:hypothetical protein
VIHEESLRAVAHARINEHFIKPLYTDFGFASIPMTLQGLFEHKPAGIPFGPRADLYAAYDRIILVLIDALGWHFFSQYAQQHPFLRRFLDEGLAIKLTSQFPSTTAAHVTTIHTGLPVGQSGVYEWFMYVPQLDAIIAPLLYSFAGDEQRNTLVAAGAEPEQLLPSRTLYRELAQQGVDSFVLQNIEYARSPYNTTVTAGARLMPYRTASEACVMLAQHAERQRERAYYMLYFDTVDTVAHTHGPDSPHVAAEITIVLETLERALHPHIAQLPGRTLLLVTADHGQIGVNPQTVVYLDRTLPELARLLKCNRNGQILAPAGSSRDMFLHVHDAQHHEALELLRRHLHGRADVRPVRELIDEGYFGPQVAPVFLERVGDIVVLPYAGEAVWWWGDGRFAKRVHGSHGGLCAVEMETMLLALAYQGGATRQA